MSEDAGLAQGAKQIKRDMESITVKQEAEASNVSQNESWRGFEGFGPWILQVYSPGSRALCSLAMDR